MIALLRRLLAPRWVVRNFKGAFDVFPTVAGHYRVMISGDSETDGPHVYYDYPDYENWAWYQPSGEPGEIGTFTGAHDEETDQVFAWCGPYLTRPYVKKR